MTPGTGRHEGDPLPEAIEQELAKIAQELANSDTPRRHKHVRVTTQPVPGTDATPTPEPSRSSGTENDDRLRADKPPHWG